MTPGRLADRRVDVARQGEVDADQRRPPAGGLSAAATASASSTWPTAPVQEIDQVGVGERVGEPRRGRRRPRRRPRRPAARRVSGVRLAIDQAADAGPVRRRGGERAHRPGADDEHAGRPAEPPERRRGAGRSPASTSDAPARSMPVSAWARLPTRRACWNELARAPGRRRPAPARRAAPRGPGRGSGPRRRPSSPARRRPRTGGARRGPRSGRRGAASARRAATPVVAAQQRRRGRPDRRGTVATSA